jgi:hypothetical protein
VFAALTVRKLKPGSYDEWRQAWQPEEWPEGSQQAYILRNVNDPDEIIAFGFFEGDLDAVRSDDRMREMQQRRFDRMAPFVDSTGADSLYEVIEVVTPERAGAAAG